MKHAFVKLQTVVVLLLVGAFLAACGSVAPQQGAATPTPLPAVQAGKNGLVAEGKVVPNDSVNLTFGSSGKVAEILFKEGDTVKAGDVIARLDGRAPMESAIATSESELLNSQQALADLNKNNAVAAANAFQKLAAANKSVKDASYDLYYFTVPTTIAGMDSLKAIQVTSDALDKARKAFEPYKTESQLNATRKDLQTKVNNAQSDYNAAVRHLDLEVRLQQAQATLAQAQKDYDTLKKGPDPDDVAAAQARIKAAEAALTSAKASLSNLELVATISGTIVKLDMTLGESVTPGNAVVSLADFSKLYIETDNLTEIDVVKVSEGQSVSIVADALPDVKMNGKVEKIGKMFEEKRGDVTYTVKITIENPDPKLRWGMTVATTFE